MREEDMSLAVTLPRLPKTEKKNPNSVRFLGILKQPDSSAGTDTDLDEIWASDDVDQDRPLGPAADYLPEPEPVYSSGFGLSSLLAAAEVRTPAIRRTPVPVSARRFAGTTESMARSAPMNVPTWRHVRRTPLLDDVEDEYGEEAEEEEEEMVPPHVIVARSHVTTFSVFEGVGRTLKGRDLRRVRNAVFQKTGFLD